MRKWNLIIDVALCHNCNGCVLATKDEYIGNDFPAYAAAMPAQAHEWIRIKRRQRGEAPVVDVAYVPTMCNHCDNPPCADAAGDDSVSKRADGIVIFDPVKTKGRNDLPRSCPYGAISWNEERNLPQTWPFDAHLLDAGWREPRCVQACPTGAMRALKVSDAEMEKVAAAEGLQVLLPKLGTKPRVYYRNLHRYSTDFISGTVVVRKDGIEECVEGASVVLKNGSAGSMETRTDAFGEFKFDGLEAKGAEYDLLVTHEGRSFRRGVTLKDSCYLGILPL